MLGFYKSFIGGVKIRIVRKTINVPSWLFELFLCLSGIFALIAIMAISIYLDSIIAIQDRKYMLILAFVLVVMGLYHMFLKKIKISYYQGFLSIELPP